MSGFLLLVNHTQVIFSTSFCRSLPVARILIMVVSNESYLISSAKRRKGTDSAMQQPIHYAILADIPEAPQEVANKACSLIF